ncbi:hypothetical protein CPB86DRAFT_829076 [Serendipita vermifera]|nr:hypothetical protein CPB86DRAFT_829076 [Serendipita vermifera]
MPPQPTKTRAAGPKAKLFQGLKFALAPTVAVQNQRGLRQMLEDRGAIEVNSFEDAECVFTTSLDFEGVNRVSPEGHLVLPQWVERSIFNESRYRYELFSPDPFNIFAGLVFCSDHLPPGDLETIVAGVHARGGLYRDAMTRDVTHLLVLAASGDKYRTARTHQAKTKVKIVMVHWFDDCFKIEQRLPEEPYEQPLIDAERQEAAPATDEEGKPIVGPRPKPPIVTMSKEARDFYTSLENANTPPSNNEPAEDSSSKRDSGSYSSGSRSQRADVWEGRRILLSNSLLISKERRETVEREIMRHGGHVVHPDYRKRQKDNEQDENDKIQETCWQEIEYAEALRNPELSKIEDDKRYIVKLSAWYRSRDKDEAREIHDKKVDVLITKYRSGLAYLAVMESIDEGDVVVGTLQWLFYVHASGSRVAPTAQLLHFPIPRGSVPGIRDKEITVSNYYGAGRDYIRKLIAVMVGPHHPDTPEVFTTTLSKRTDILIAGKLEGAKVERAQAWKISIVNHLWLEETLRNWKMADLADPRYNHWKSTITYHDILPISAVTKSSSPEEIRKQLKAEIGTIQFEMTRLGYRTDSVMEGINSYYASQGTQPDPSSSPVTPRPVPQDASASIDQVSQELKVVRIDRDESSYLDENVEFVEATVYQERQKHRVDRSAINVQAFIANTPASDPKTNPPGTSPKYAQSQGEPATGSTRRVDRGGVIPSSGQSDCQNDVQAERRRQISSSQPISGSRNASPIKPPRSSFLDGKGKLKGLDKFLPKGNTAANPLGLGSPVDFFSTGSPRKGTSISKLDESFDGDMIIEDTKANKRGKMRSIRSQEMQEPFRVESQGDLMSRRNKIMTTTIVEQNESDSDEGHKKSTKIAVKSAKKRGIKKLRQSIAGQQGPLTSGRGEEMPSKGRRRKPNRTSDSEDGDAVSSRSAANMDRDENSDADDENAPPSGPPSPSSLEEVHDTRPKRKAADKASSMTKHMLDPLVFAQQRQLDLDCINSAQKTAENKRKRTEEDDQPIPKRKRPSEAVSDKEHELPHDGTYHLMTSKVELSDDQRKKLIQLGVVMAKNPLKCTILVANSILRTEKFVLALSVGATIVNDGWVRECVKRNQLADPADFLLRDEAGEEKYEMKSLQRSLYEAKTGGRRLLAGHTFYLGPAMGEQTKASLVKVIKATGGSVRMSIPSNGEIGDHTKNHILAVPEAEETLQNLIEEGIPIYSHEMVMYAILQQKPLKLEGRMFRLFWSKQAS